MCDERERLLDYLYDACDADERHRVEQHLHACDGCRDEISSLRAVRLDLLAWNVPDHGSVWKPFAPARLKPWYREVPAWALAAAASVMFLLGFGGGMLARHVAPQAAVTTAAVAAPLVPQLNPSPTSAEVAAMEKRILATVQSQLDARLQPVAAHVRGPVPGVSKDELIQEVQRVVASSEERQRQALASSMRTLLQDSEKTFLRRTKFDSFVNRELDPMVRWEVTQAMQQTGGQ